MRLLFLFPILFLIQLASGQGVSGHERRLSILAGSQQSHLLDQQFSTLAYRANEISIDLGYHHGWNRHHVWTNISASTGDLYPDRFRRRTIFNTIEDIHGHQRIDSVPLTGHTRTAEISFGYKYDLLHHTAIDIRIGGIVRNQLMYPSSFTNLGILNAASFLIDIEMVWRQGAMHEWHAGLSVPVIGYNTRFPYSGTVSRPNQSLFEAFFDGGTKLVTLDTYQQMRFTAGYRYKVSDHTALGLRYDFMYQYYSIPVPLTTYAHRLGIAIDFSF